MFLPFKVLYDKLDLYSNNLPIIDMAISAGFLLVMFFKPIGHSILFIID